VLTQFRAEHRDFGLVTGVVEADGRLWMGRIAGPGLAYFRL
jgi:hypothetical protein